MCERKNDAKLNEQQADGVLRIIFRGVLAIDQTTLQVRDAGSVSERAATRKTLRELDATYLIRRLDRRCGLTGKQVVRADSKVDGGLRKSGHGGGRPRDRAMACGAEVPVSQQRSGRLPPV